MKYMVMECHPGYAVVLDEDGRFLKVANRRYEVGQTVADVIEMQVPQAEPQKKKVVNKWMHSMAAMAACLMLVVTSVFQMGQMTYASVYMTINPEVRIDVNRKDVVVGLDGVNADGDDLIEGYVYQKKNLDLVMDELVDRAIDMGYLHEGGQISLVLDADSDEWVVTHSDALTSHLNAHLDEKLMVTIEVTDTKTQSNQVVIPIAPGESSYGESDYGEIASPPQPPVSSEPVESNYGESHYGDSSYDDGQTDYGDPDDDDDSQSEYDTGDSQTDYEGSDDYDDGQSEYDSDNDADDDRQSNYFDSDDGQSEYDPDDDSDQTDYADRDEDDDSQSDYDDDDDD